MFESIKAKIAAGVVKKRFIRKNFSPVSFNNFSKDAINYFVILPENDEDFRNCFHIIKYLFEKGKNITLFISEPRYSIVPEKEKFKVVSFNIQQMTKLRIPDSSLRDRIAKRSYDVILNLNRFDDVFLNSVVFVANATYRVGFKNSEISEYLNLQFPMDKNSSKISYENLLNSLKMF